MNSSIELFHIVVKVPKEHSSFVYFLLESAEGLGFYSTLPFKSGDFYRIIDIKGDFKLKEEIKSLIGGLKRNTPLEILKE